MQAIDYELQLGQLTARLETFSDNVQRVLNEVGAPSISELSDRFKRFAENNKTLMATNRELTDRLAIVRQERAKIDEAYTMACDSLREMRVQIANQEAAASVVSNSLQAKHAALKLANELLEQPMFAAFVKDIRPVQKAINAAIKGSEG
jgi:chromosome segregation ATPase